MNWMEEHAELIVEPLRNRRYQARVRAELMDHMGSLYQSCLEEGMSESEARGETLSQLGSVRQLRREYRQAELVLRSQSLGFCVSRVWLGAYLMGILYILVTLILGQIISRIAGPLANDGLSHLGGLVPQALSGTPAYWQEYDKMIALTGLIYQIPFPIGALFLRWLFRRTQHPLRPIAAGMLLAWAGEKLAILSISALIYGMPLWNLPSLLQRIHTGGDTTAGFFTIPYIVWTLFFALVLALLASLIPTSAQKKQLC